MAHQPARPSNAASDRLALPLFLPLIAAAVTILLIVVIGKLLLSVRGMYEESDPLAAQAPVAVALVLALGVLLLCTLAAATWGRARR